MILLFKFWTFSFVYFAAATMASFISRYVMEDWAQEGGDPCLPAPWSWVQCNSESQPRIVSMYVLLTS